MRWELLEIAGCTTAGVRVGPAGKGLLREPPSKTGLLLLGWRVREPPRDQAVGFIRSNHFKEVQGSFGAGMRSCRDATGRLQVQTQPLPAHLAMEHCWLAAVCEVGTVRVMLSPGTAPGSVPKGWGCGDSEDASAQGLADSCKGCEHPRGQPQHWGQHRCTRSPAAKPPAPALLHVRTGELCGTRGSPHRLPFVINLFLLLQPGGREL